MFKKLKTNKVISSLFVFLFIFNTFGSGMVLANQEIPEGFRSTSTDITRIFNGLEELVNRPNILLIEDVDPWGTNEHHYILQSMGEVRKISPSSPASMTADFVNFSLYDIVVFSNDQLTSTYEYYERVKYDLEEYVSNGGILVFGAADRGWNSGRLNTSLPGGVAPISSFQFSNYVSDETHPIITGELTGGTAITDDHLSGSNISHTSFSEGSLPNDSTVILRDSNGVPTLVEYSLGNGTVIASGLTWELHLREFGSAFARMALDDLFMHAVTIASENIFFNVSPAAGVGTDFVDVTVSVANNHSGVAGFDLELLFDNTQIKPIAIVSSGESISGAIISNVHDINTDLNSINTVTAVTASASNSYVNGELFTVRFQIQPDAEIGSYPILLTGMITNEDLDIIQFGARHGVVHIFDEANVMYGDIYSDGFVDIRDAVKLAQYFVGKVEFNDFERLVADVHRDQRITVQDAIKLGQYLADFENIVLGTN